MNTFTKELKNILKSDYDSHLKCDIEKYIDDNCFNLDNIIKIIEILSSYLNNTNEYQTKDFDLIWSIRIIIQQYFRTFYWFFKLMMCYGHYNYITKYGSNSSTILEVCKKDLDLYHNYIKTKFNLDENTKINIMLIENQLIHLVYDIKKINHN